MMLLLGEHMNVYDCITVSMLLCFDLDWPQIGVDFALKVINWDADTVVRLQLWDIAGEYNLTHERQRC